MIRVRYSPHPKPFVQALQKLFQQNEKYRPIIKEKAFAILPWKGTDIIGQMKKYLLKYRHFKTIAVIGIGGSSLGSKALTQALNQHSIIYVNNVDPDFVHAQLDRVDLRKTLFLLMSKSGETMEILALSSILLSKIPDKKNFLIVTDQKNSSLATMGRKFNIPIILSPPAIPGRFSVFSIVGLLPAAFLRISIESILDGAQHASWDGAYRLACYQYLHFREKKNIVVIFPYAEQLSAFSDWYIQLIAESIGKSKKIGITPIKAMGVKDQHSQLQLFLDGPDDKFYIFLKPQKFHTDFSLPGKKFSLALVFHAEYEGVKKAFLQRKKPFCEISFPSVIPEILGELFSFFELEVAFLGALLKVDIENQPAVEESKKITRSILRNL